MFFNKPKKYIKSIPSGKTEDEMFQSIYRDVVLGHLYEKDKTTEIKSVTSSLVFDTLITYCETLLMHFKNKFPNEVIKLKPEVWETINGFFLENIYLASQIYLRDKQLRDEQINIPIGKDFEQYYKKELTKFDKSNEYADLLIPKYLFEIIKKLSLNSFIEFEKIEPTFKEIDEKFKESFLIQYTHLLGACVASYLIQDSFI